MLGRDAAGGLAPSKPRGDRGHAQADDQLHRLSDDPAGHLRRSGGPFAEDDRHLDDARAATMRPTPGFDLEAVPRAGGLSQADRLEQLAPPGLEATGQVAV